MPEISRDTTVSIYIKWRQAAALFTQQNGRLHIFTAETYFAARRLAGHMIEKGETDQDIYPFADVRRAVFATRGKKLSPSKANQEIEKNLLDEGGIDTVLNKNSPEYETFVMKLLNQADEVLTKFAESKILTDRQALNIYREITGEIRNRQIKYGLERGPAD